MHLLAATAVNSALVIMAFIAAPGGSLVSLQYGALVAGVTALAAVIPLAGAVFSDTSQWSGR
jgi:hypothetical protein